MEKKKNKRGIVFLVTGILLLLWAVGWYMVNLYEDQKAGETAADILEKLVAQTTTQMPVPKVTTIPDGPDSTTASEVERGETQLPYVMIDGNGVCGRVVIEKLGIELPVFYEWSYTKLKEAPCRYTGSIEAGNMIIAAHNYNSHFGNLKSLQVNDSIYFIDVTGKEHGFVVKEVTTLDGTAVAHMQSGQWDFTLFTCTKNGQQRVTVRCDRK